ncbi:unnamed protein product [Closterium sp. NIES-65]|nr:unnamed protein product [Closterium sp. NIES-65]CAI5982524.1 unnamed protein product [Closterium sp. NIES-65]
MGRVPVRLKEVTYALSPFEQKIMPGLWKDMGKEWVKKIKNNWLDAATCVGPIAGTYWYVHNKQLIDRGTARLVEVDPICTSLLR